LPCRRGILTSFRRSRRGGWILMQFLATLQR